MKNGNVLDEIFFSIDCEFEGPIPPLHSLMSFGSVAFTLRDGILGEATYNLFPLRGSTMHPDNKRFWDRNLEALKATRIDRWDPYDAFYAYAAHVKELSEKRGKPIMIEYPGGCDFSWMFWYFHNFVGYCPFGFAPHCMKSYAAAVLKIPFRDSAKARYPKHWFDRSLKHTHLALDDARGQADMFMRIMCENLDIELPPGVKEI